jgi:putative transposase
MPRSPRTVIPNTPHHANQRGSRQQQTFLSDTGRLVYLDDLPKYATEAEVAGITDYLMTNRTHETLAPTHPDSLEPLFNPLHTKHAARINNQFGKKGHLSQDRYHSCVLDEQHFWASLRYVELNPARSRMCACVKEYRRPSARAHHELAANPIIDSRPAWSVHLQYMPDSSVDLHSGRYEAHMALTRQVTAQNKAPQSQQFLETMKEVTGPDNLPRTQGSPKNVLERQSSRNFVISTTSH